MDKVALAEQLAEQGYQLFQMGDLRGAQSKFEAALELAPNDPDMRRVYADILQRTGNRTGAEDQMRKAVESASNARTKVQCLADLAAFYFKFGRLEEATEAAVQAEEIDPSHPSVAATMMDIANAQGHSTSAEAWKAKARERYRRKGTRAGGAPLGPGEPERFLQTPPSDAQASRQKTTGCGSLSIMGIVLTMITIWYFLR